MRKSLLFLGLAFILLVFTSFNPDMIPNINQAEFFSSFQAIQKRFTTDIHIDAWAVAGIVIVIFIYWCCMYFVWRSAQFPLPQVLSLQDRPPNMLMGRMVVLSTRLFANHEKRFERALLVDLAYRKILTMNSAAQMIYVSDQDDADLTVGQRQFVDVVRDESNGLCYYGMNNPTLYDAMDDMARGLKAYGQDLYEAPLIWVNQLLMVIVLVSIGALYTWTSGYFIALMLFSWLGGLLFYLFLNMPFADYDGMSWWTKGFIMVALLFGGGMIGVMPTYAAWSYVTDSNGTLYTALFITLNFTVLTFLLYGFGRFTSQLKPEHGLEQAQVLSFQSFLKNAKRYQSHLLNPDIFRHYLAYAVALNVDQPWLKQYKKQYPEQYHEDENDGVIAIYHLVHSNIFRKATEFKAENDNE